MESDGPLSIPGCAVPRVGLLRNSSQPIKILSSDPTRNFSFQPFSKEKKPHLYTNKIMYFKQIALAACKSSLFSFAFGNDSISIEYSGEYSSRWIGAGV